MRFSDVSLFLNQDEHEGMYDSDFAFRSRYVCNFVRRRLIALKVQTDGFNRITICGCRHPQESCSIYENVLRAQVLFDKQEYESLRTGEQHEFFIGMLLEGIRKCARQFDVPLSDVEKAIDDFRLGGYVNEWVHQKKLLRPLGLRASLRCKLDTEKFLLTLRVVRKDEVIFDKPILEDLPDETCFAYKFKDMVLDGSTLVVRGRTRKPTFLLDTDDPREVIRVRDEEMERMLEESTRKSNEFLEEIRRGRSGG